MPADLVLKALIAMAPVLILLMVFDRLDVFNLIPMREIALLTAIGAGLALVSYVVNWRVMEGFPIGWGPFTRYVAPPIEEAIKAAPIIYLFSRNRLGFKLDAAIAGFAVGAGFSVAENAWYLLTLTGTNITDWLVRGFGTAVMHGAATALFAVIAHEMSETQAESAAGRYQFKPWLFLPGFLVAVIVHSTFNHFPHQPLLAMVLTLLLAPATLFLTLARSEQATRAWLAKDAATHREILAQIRAGHFAESKAGAMLHEIGPVGAFSEAELTAYAELKMEMVLRAEELILASHEGSADTAGDTEREKLRQLEAMSERLGAAVTTALDSRLGFSRNDLYELNRLRARLRI